MRHIVRLLGRNQASSFVSPDTFYSYDYETPAARSAVSNYIYSLTEPFLRFPMSIENNLIHLFRYVQDIARFPQSDRQNLIWVHTARTYT